MDFNISPETIHAATSGAVTQKDLTKWRERGLWLTELQPFDHGRQRQYSYENALEAVLAWGLVGACGLSRGVARSIMAMRCASGRDAGWAGDGFSALPDWTAKDVWWVVGASGDGQGTAGVRAVTGPNIPNDLRDEPGIRLLNVSGLKARLDSAIAASLA